MKRAAWILALLAGVLAGASHGRWWSVPDRHNPWAPLQYADAPNWLTGFKLDRLEAEPAACLAFMAQTPWRVRPVADRPLAGGCGWQDALQVERSAVDIGRPFTLNCATAASTALWERHVVQPAAERLFGVPLRRLEHLGSFACRDIAGRPGRRSEHASANALDIAAFVLQDGRRISLAADWNGPAPRAAFLRAVHQGACPLFQGVLGPDYNAAHADHFHMDRGRFSICR